jgi:hypothetical protein
MDEKNLEDFSVEEYLNKKESLRPFNLKLDKIRADKALPRTSGRLFIKGKLTYLNKFKRFIKNRKVGLNKSKLTEDDLQFVQNLHIDFECNNHISCLLYCLDSDEFFLEMEQVLSKLGKMFPDLNFKYFQRVRSKKMEIRVSKGKSLIGIDTKPMSWAEAMSSIAKRNEKGKPGFTILLG